MQNLYNSNKIYRQKNHKNEYSIVIETRTAFWRKINEKTMKSFSQQPENKKKFLVKNS